MGFAGGRNAESEAAVIVGFCRCGQVKIGERNLLGTLGSEVPERLADDGVVANFLFVLIAEHQNCIGQDRRTLCLVLSGTRFRGGTRVKILIAVSFFLAQHLLLFETLLIHLVGSGAIAFVVFVVGRAGIPPPGRIVIAAVRPRIAKAATGETEAVIAESIGAEAGAAKSVLVKLPMRGAALRERRTVRKSARGNWTGAHATNMAATGVTAAETTAVATAKARVSAEAAAVSATGVTSAVLRPQG